MARIGPRNTAPELVVRRTAHRLGFRFRLHRNDLPGTPDLVFAGYRLAVYVHGCFWHRHEGCSNSTMPKTRPEFWISKFNSNVARDRRNLVAMDALGWRTLVIWECETEDPALLESLLVRSLSDRSSGCTRVAT